MKFSLVGDNIVVLWVFRLGSTLQVYWIKCQTEHRKFFSLPFFQGLERSTFRIMDVIRKCMSNRKYKGSKFTCKQSKMCLHLDRQTLSGIFVLGGNCPIAQWVTQESFTLPEFHFTI